MNRRFEHFPFLVPYTLQSPQPRHCRASIAVRLLSLAKSTPPQHCPCPALAAQVVRGATTTASRCRSSTPSDSVKCLNSQVNHHHHPPLEAALFIF
ncbi:hypothetical protein QYF36_019981 [Acer negundo]|nr:hypothetical protein QYF36_019981 [Acer negundo]